MKCLFWNKLVIPKYHQSCLNLLTFNWNIFSLINIMTIFCAVFMSLLMAVKLRKSLKIYITVSKLHVLWVYYEEKTQIGKLLIILNMFETYLESCFGHMVFIVCHYCVNCLHSIPNCKPHMLCWLIEKCDLPKVITVYIFLLWTIGLA